MIFMNSRRALESRANGRILTQTRKSLDDVRVARQCAKQLTLTRFCKQLSRR